MFMATFLMFNTSDLIFKCKVPSAENPPHPPQYPAHRKCFAGRKALLGTLILKKCACKYVSIHTPNCVLKWGSCDTILPAQQEAGLHSQEPECTLLSDSPWNVRLMLVDARPLVKREDMVIHGCSNHGF